MFLNRRLLPHLQLMRRNHLRLLITTLHNFRRSSLPIAHPFIIIGLLRSCPLGDGVLPHTFLGFDAVDVGGLVGFFFVGWFAFSELVFYVRIAALDCGGLLLLLISSRS